MNSLVFRENVRFFSLLLLTVIASYEVILAQDLVRIRKIQDDQIVLVGYNTQTQSIDISEMVVIKELEENDEILELEMRGKDPKLVLLENGYIRLKNTFQAPKGYLEAQTIAKNSGLGGWNGDGKIIKAQLVVWGLEAFGGIGGIWLFIKTSIIFFRRKKVSMLILGMGGSGKSALFNSFVNPKMPKKDLASLNPSAVKMEKQSTQTFPHGKYEICPKITDIPGSQFGATWRHLWKNRDVLVVVLSHTPKIGARFGEPLDQRFVDMQLGYISLLLEGGVVAQSEENYIHKTSCIIIYISKFDLCSKHRPEDTASKKKKEELRRLFQEHIESGRQASLRSNIKFKVIYGSPVEKWGFDDILKAIVDTL